MVALLFEVTVDMSIKFDKNTKSISFLRNKSTKTETNGIGQQEEKNPLLSSLEKDSEILRHNEQLHIDKSICEDSTVVKRIEYLKGDSDYRAKSNTPGPTEKSSHKENDESQQLSFATLSDLAQFVGMNDHDTNQRICGAFDDTRSFSDSESNLTSISDLTTSQISNFSRYDGYWSCFPKGQAEYFFNFFKLVYCLLWSGDLPGAIQLLLIGSSLRFVASILVFVFTPVLVSRKYPSSMHDSSFSLFNALVVLSCGSLSSYFGGRLGECLVKTHGLNGLAQLVALSCLLSIGPFVLSFQVENFWSAMICLASGYLVGEAWMGASMALLQHLSPPRSQGLAMSIYLFLNWTFSAIGTGCFLFLVSYIFIWAQTSTLSFDRCYWSAGSRNKRIVKCINNSCNNCFEPQLHDFHGIGRCDVPKVRTLISILTQGS